MISRVLNNKVTWIMAPLVSWSLVTAVAYKATHPFTVYEIGIIKCADVEKALGLTVATDSDKTRKLKSALPFNSNFQPIRQAELYAQMDSIAALPYQSMYKDVVGVLNEDRTASRKIDNTMEWPEWWSGFFVNLAQDHNEEELLTRLNQTKNSEANKIIMWRGKFNMLTSAVDIALEYGLSKQGAVKTNQVLLSAAESLKSEMPTYTRVFYSDEASDASGNRSLSWQFIFNGDARITEMKEKGGVSNRLDPTQLSGHLFWTDYIATLRAVENGLKLSKQHWINLLEPAIKAKFPEDKVSLAAGVYLSPSKVVEHRLKQIHIEATRIELRRAALAALQFMAEQGRLPTHIGDLAKYGYTAAEPITEVESAAEIRQTNLAQIKKTMYKPVGGLDITSFTPTYYDIQTWLKTPDYSDLTIKRKEDTSDTISWTISFAPNSQVKDSLINSQDALVLGLWLKSIENRPGLRIVSKDFQWMDDKTTAVLDDAALQKYWKFVEPTTSRDKLEQYAARGPIGVSVEFVTAKYWGRISSSAKILWTVSDVILRPVPNL